MKPLEGEVDPLCFECTDRLLEQMRIEEEEEGEYDYVRDDFNFDADRERRMK